MQNTKKPIHDSSQGKHYCVVTHFTSVLYLNGFWFGSEIGKSWPAVLMVHLGVTTGLVLTNQTQGKSLLGVGWEGFWKTFSSLKKEWDAWEKSIFPFSLECQSVTIFGATTLILSDNWSGLPVTCCQKTVTGSLFWAPLQHPEISTGSTSLSSAAPQLGAQVHQTDVLTAS